MQALTDCTAAICTRLRDGYHKFRVPPAHRGSSPSPFCKRIWRAGRTISGFVHRAVKFCSNPKSSEKARKEMVHGSIVKRLALFSKSAIPACVYAEIIASRWRKTREARQKVFSVLSSPLSKFRQLTTTYQKIDPHRALYAFSRPNMSRDGYPLDSPDPNRLWFGQRTERWYASCATR